MKQMSKWLSWFYSGLVVIVLMVAVAYPVLADIPESITTMHTVSSTETVILDHDVQIMAGGRLVIEPGARIVLVEQVEPAAIFGIYIQPGGEMIVGASGAAEVVLQPQKFSEINPPVRYTGWQGIKNQGGSLRIYNSRIQMANLAVWSVGGETIIENSTLEYCHSYGVRADAGSLKITGSTFHDNGDAIYIQDFKPQTALISGNTFNSNNHSIRLTGENYATIRANNFTDGNAGTIVLEEGTINHHVNIAFNNFYHNRDQYDPASETYFYIIQNEGTPIGIFDCYWSNLETVYSSVQSILSANLVGPVDQSGKVTTITIVSPKSTPVSTAADLISPELLELSPLKVRPGTVTLTVIISDTGWGVDPATVRISVGGQSAGLVSYTYNNRQYQFTASVELVEGEYAWSVQAADIAGNALVDPKDLQSQMVTVTLNVTSVMTPQSWQAWNSGEYHLITLPIEPYQQDHLALLGLSSPGSTLVRWQSGAYHYYGEPDLEQFAPGRGFWIKIGDGDRISPREVGGTLSSSATPIPLTEGWHLIGNPYEAALDLKKRMTFFYGNPVKEHPFQQAVMDGYISNGLWGYANANYYSERNQLQPWQGYWLRVKKACSIQFRDTDFDYLNQNLIDWEMQLTASQNTQSDSASYFGTVRFAQNGIDVFDSEKPPVMQSSLRSYFLPKGAVTAYGADYRSLASGREVWQYRVTGLNPGEAWIRWGGLPEVPSQYQLILRDTVTGKTVDLRQTSGYQFMVQGETERLFEVIVANAVGSSLQLSNVRLSDNPFAPLRETLIINFDLNLDAAVEVRIYDWVGNLVYVAPVSRLSAGIDHEFRWQGRNNLGKMVANGIYFCKIVAKSGTSQSTQTLKIAVVN